MACWAMVAAHFRGISSGVLEQGYPAVHGPQRRHQSSWPMPPKLHKSARSAGLRSWFTVGDQPQVRAVRCGWLGPAAESQ